MKDIKISIIIPAYDRLSYLKKCLKSIKSQNYKNYEIIVINDSSKENLEGIKELCDKYIVNEINLGPAYSRNLGVLNSKGDFFLFLDSDTVLRQGTLKKLKEIFESDSSIGIIGGSGPPDKSGNDVKYIIGKSYNHFGKSKKTFYYPRKDCEDKRLCDCKHIESAFLAVHKEIFEQVGGFDPYWHYIGEDRDFCLSVNDIGYRVVVSLNTRAIHFSLHSDRSINIKNFPLFLMKRYLEVAIKREGISGGIRWLIGNAKSSLNPKNTFYLLKKFKDHKKLGTRKKTNFLSRVEMEKYYSIRIAELLNNKLPLSISFPLSTPENIVLFSTLRCNALCNHCFIKKLSGSEHDDISKGNILKLVGSLNQPANISLSGGEPFLRDDLKIVLDGLMKSSKVKSVKILSNGFFSEKIESICREICRKYKKPLNLQLSLDGLAKTHNKIRCMKDGFRKVINSCEKAKNMKSKYSNFSFIVAITLMKDNMAEIEDLIDYLEKRKYPSKLSLVRGNSFSTFNVPSEIVDKDYNPRHKNLSMNTKEIKDLLKKISQKYPSYFDKYQKHKLKIMLDTLYFKNRQIPCYAGYKDSVVFSDGRIALCEQVKPFGDLSDWGWNFHNAWNSKEAWEHRRKLTKCSCIHGCNISTSVSMQKFNKD